MALLLLCVSVSSAQANFIKPEHFFDFDYAKSLWLNMSNEQLDVVFNEECPSGGPDDVWRESYRRNPEAALIALETDPNATLIKRCYDTQLTYEKWAEVYRFWRSALRRNSAGWNKDPDPESCGITSLLNIFTRTCTDLPDWRSPKNAAEDAADIAAEHKRRAAIANQQ